MRDRYVRKMAKLLGLKDGGTISLSHRQLVGIREHFRKVWRHERPDEQFETGFLEMSGCHPNTLTEGIVEYSKRGLSFVLYGVAPDEKWVDVYLDMPHKGDWMISGSEPQTPFEE